MSSQGHQWSITGHAFGGMVAQVAALDLGWRGLSHWSHSHSSPRLFNAAAANVSPSYLLSRKNGDADYFSHFTGIQQSLSRVSLEKCFPQLPT